MLRARAVARAGHRLVAVSDVNVAAMAAASSEAGTSRHADWSELLAVDALDAVIVATPPDLHARMTIAALSAGKHVLCEKPLARTPGECAGMVDAADAANRFLATGFNYRFYPAFAAARAWLDSERIGRLLYARAYGGYSAASHTQAWVHDEGVTGGGALHDIGIHLIDLTRWFLGEARVVAGATAGGAWSYPGCEDNGFAILEGPAGRIGFLHASWTEWGKYQFAVELVGDRGRIRAGCFPMFAELLETAGPGTRVRTSRRSFPATFVGEHVRSYRWVVTRSFVAELRAFGEAVRGSDTPIASGRDGLRAIEIASSVSHPGSASRSGAQ